MVSKASFALFNSCRFSFSMYSASSRLSLFCTFFSTNFMLPYSSRTECTTISSSTSEFTDKILNTLKAFTKTYCSLGCSENCWMLAKPWSYIPLKLDPTTSMVIFAFTMKALEFGELSEVERNPSISMYPPMFFLILFISFSPISNPRYKVIFFLLLASGLNVTRLCL